MHLESLLRARRYWPSEKVLAAAAAGVLQVVLAGVLGHWDLPALIDAGGTLGGVLLMYLKSDTLRKIGQEAIDAELAALKEKADAPKA